jgi:hypothetical protein
MAAKTAPQIDHVVPKASISMFWRSPLYHPLSDCCPSGRWEHPKASFLMLFENFDTLQATFPMMCEERIQRA